MCTGVFTDYETLMTLYEMTSAIIEFRWNPRLGADVGCYMPGHSGSVPFIDSYEGNWGSYRGCRVSKEAEVFPPCCHSLFYSSGSGDSGGVLGRMHVHFSER